MATKRTNTPVEEWAQTRLREVCQLFGLTPEVVTALEDGVLIIDVKTGQDDLFISRSSDPLLALQHLLRLMIKRDFPVDNINLSLNIGGFHQKQRERLMQIAHEAAHQVRATGTAVYLPPMSSFERRLVHLALVDQAGVTSESTGVGTTRRVVVKPERDE